MKFKFPAVVCLFCEIALACGYGCGQQMANGQDSPFDFSFLEATAERNTRDPGAAVKEFKEQFDRDLFIRDVGIDLLRNEFPIKAGMTLQEMDKAIQENEKQPFSHERYHLGWEKRNIKDGSGWVHFWANGKQLLHCDIVIEKGIVKSVWVMPGNAEVVVLVHYRLTGTGPHVGPGETFPK